MEAHNDQKSEGFRISGDWSIQKKHLKEEFTSLTDEDLDFKPGDENELLIRVENRLDKNQEEAIDIIQKAHSVII